MDAREGKDGRRKKRGSLVCFSSLHFALGAVAGGYMYKGARVPVARSLAISSIVSRSQSCSGYEPGLRKAIKTIRTGARRRPRNHPYLHRRLTEKPSAPAPKDDRETIRTHTGV